MSTVPRPPPPPKPAHLSVRSIAGFKKSYKSSFSSSIKIARTAPRHGSPYTAADLSATSSFFSGKDTYRTALDEQEWLSSEGEEEHSTPKKIDVRSNGDGREAATGATSPKSTSGGNLSPLLPSQPLPTTGTTLMVSQGVISVSTSSPIPTPSSSSGDQPASQAHVSRGRSARALYDFDGEANFNELSVLAGECFDILNEELAGGWSLAIKDGVRGLVPRGYYCYINDFVSEPPRASGEAPPDSPSINVNTPVLSNTHLSSPTKSTSVGQDLTNAEFPSEGGAAQRNYTGGSAPTPPPSLSLSSAFFNFPSLITPGGSNSTIVASGGWHGTLFGGRSFNRFSPFVTSGAEEFIISGPSGTALKPGSGSSNMRREGSGGSSSIASDRTWNLWPAGEQGGTIRAKKDYGDESKVSSTQEEASSWDKMVADADAAAAAQDATAEWGRDVEEEPKEPCSVLGKQESLEGSDETNGEEAGVAEHDKHYIEGGPAGPRWKAKTPPFAVRVHSPEKRTKLSGIQEYTVFQVTSYFSSPYGTESPEDDSTEDGASEGHGPTLTVERRFSQFFWLASLLSRKFPALVLPALPEKQYAGRFSKEFVETRRADLEMWLDRVVRHPVVRYAESVTFFLSCEDEVEWRKMAPRVAASSNSGSASDFFAHVYHPEFNVDTEEATTDFEAFEKHTRCSELGVKGVLQAVKGVRNGAVASSNTYRGLSYSLLRLITGEALGLSEDEAPITPVVATTFTSPEADSKLEGATEMNGASSAFGTAFPPMGRLGKRSEKGAYNEQGAWCWRDDCEECLSLTKAVQATAESLQAVADLHDDHARRTLLSIHEGFKDISRPHAQHAALLEMHRATLAKYRMASGSDVDEETPEHPSSTSGTGVSQAATIDGLPIGPDEPIPSSSGLGGPEMSPSPHSGAGKDAPPPAEDVIARCETVLNVTMSEMDRAHDERVEDYRRLMEGYLDGQIDFFERVVANLRHARSQFDDSSYHALSASGPRLASPYEQELYRPRLAAVLPMPSAPVLPSSAAIGGIGRPVSLAAEAITEGVGSLFLGFGAGGGAVAPVSADSATIKGRSHSSATDTRRSVWGWKRRG